MNNKIDMMKYNAPGLSAIYDTNMDTKEGNISMPELVRYRKTLKGYITVPIKKTENETIKDNKLKSKL